MDFVIVFIHTDRVTFRCDMGTTFQRIGQTSHPSSLALYFFKLCPWTNPSPVLLCLVSRSRVLSRGIGVLWCALSRYIITFRVIEIVAFRWQLRAKLVRSVVRLIRTDLRRLWAICEDLNHLMGLQSKQKQR